MIVCLENQARLFPINDDAVLFREKQEYIFHRNS